MCYCCSYYERIARNASNWRPLAAKEETCQNASAKLVQTRTSQLTDDRSALETAVFDFFKIVCGDRPPKMCLETKEARKLSGLRVTFE